MLSLEEDPFGSSSSSTEKDTLPFIKPCSDVMEWEGGEKEESHLCPFWDATLFSLTRLFPK